MDPSQHTRDLDALDELVPRPAGDGRMCVAVIGIDRYRAWNPLRNAVGDARGALNLFLQLGFEQVCAPLYDDAATGEALHRLVTDDLAELGPEDSLVLFFAGHGHTVVRTYPGATTMTKREGYIIPVDGDRPGGRSSTWLRLDTWLSHVTHAPVKHLLVILDACHSGVALDPVIWRGSDLDPTEAIEALRARRSRRVITSALDNQRAMDSGPVPGHSLFTGCLIEALTGGLAAREGESLVTGTDIGRYVQRRVSSYPRSMQTPDFGALELDDRGELFVCTRAVDGKQLAWHNDSGIVPLDAQDGSEVSNDSLLESRSLRDSGTGWLRRLAVLAGGLASLVAVVAAIAQRTSGTSPRIGAGAGSTDAPVDTRDGSVSDAGSTDAPVDTLDASVPDARASEPPPPPTDAATPDHRDAWISGLIFGADNRSTTMGPARVSYTQSGYKVSIEKDLGFSCGLEFDHAGDPKALLHCEARSPIWSATPSRIPLKCVTDPRQRRVRCSGYYTLHEDSDHASTAELQLSRELRLAEIVR